MAALLSGCTTAGTAPASKLFGLRLGFAAPSALDILHQPHNKLASLPTIANRKILHDTVEIGDCDLEFCRSFAFDTSGHLSVIGMTNKSPNGCLNSRRKCSSRWLEEQFGKPAEEYLRDSSLVTAWNVAGTTLTLEATSYDDKFGFVMIYFYNESPVLTSADR